MQKLAKKKDGKLLSKYYLNAKTKLKWKCTKKHIWFASPDNVKNKGSWCPKCSHIKQRLNLKEAYELAKKNYGKCLSKKYVNSRIKLKWQCRNNHIWKAKISGVKSGKWCNQCRKRTISEINLFAKKKGGQCLSKKYLSIHSPLRFKCSCGYEWKTAPSNIFNGKWCPKCAGNLRLSIETMRKIA